jgi:basic membrane protein A and related proteins
MRISRLRSLNRVICVAGALISLTAFSNADDKPTASKPFKVLVMSNGAANDASWSNSHFNGTKTFDGSNGILATYVGNLNGPPDYVQQASAYASQGYNMILMQYGDEFSAAKQIAEQFPNVIVCQGPWAPTEKELAAMPKNLCIWNVKQQDGTFLAGVVAGLVTKTDKIGAILGGEFPAIIRQSEGFILGARCVKPSISFTSQIIGTFTDVAAAQSAAKAEIASGADVILSAVDSAVSGIYAAADDAGKPVWVVPSYFDSYEQSPKHVLTSVLYNLDGITADLIKKGAAGEVKGRTYHPYNYRNIGAGQLADFHGNPAITPEVLSRYEQVRKAVQEGTITVPDENGKDAPLSIIGGGSKIATASIGCK